MRIAMESFIGGLFLWASASKLIGVNAVADSIRRTVRSSEVVAATVLLALIALEGTIGLGLLFGVQSFRLLLAAGIMLTIFTGYHLLLHFRGEDDCGCLGYRSQSALFSAIRNGILALFTLGLSVVLPVETPSSAIPLRLAGFAVLVMFLAVDYTAASLRSLAP